MDLPKTAISLCSGVGGLELGIRRALPGLRVVAYCERDPFAASVLLARMADKALEPAPVWVGDLRELDAAQFAGVHAVSAGYPCQPFSAAGKRRGDKDERHLWPDVCRIIRDVGPRYVFLENVSAHVRLGLDAVLGDLARLGFNAEWAVVSAAEAGAPHLRKRLFVLAYAERGSAQREREFGDPASEGGQVEGEGDRRERSGDSAGRSRAEVTLAYSDERGREGKRSAGLQQGERQTRRYDPYGRYGSGFPPGPNGDWSQEPTHAQPAVRRAPHGSTLSPDGVDLAFRADRLRCCGNAVVPAQAALAFRELLGRIRE